MSEQRNGMDERQEATNARMAAGNETDSTAALQAEIASLRAMTKAQGEEIAITREQDEAKDDEIERLRERCEAYKGQVKAAADEIVSLRAKIKAQGEEIAITRERDEAKDAELASLRAQLAESERRVRVLQAHPSERYWEGRWRDADAALASARKALEWRTDFENAPSPCIGWCVFPAGEEARQIWRHPSLKDQWSAHGVTQEVKAWQPLPALTDEQQKD